MSKLSSDPISVSIVEDNAGVREGLVALLQQTPGYRCTAAYANAESALEGLRSAIPDVVLMDINLPGCSGIEATRGLKELHPEARILMLTVYEEGKALFDSLRAGACGYLLKRMEPEKILEAIRDARDGGVPLNPQMAAKIANFFQEQASCQDGLESLSTRESQVLQLLAEGHLYKEIADKLGLTSGTVHDYVGAIYKKLHVRSRTEAVVKFLKGSAEAAGPNSHIVNRKNPVCILAWGLLLALTLHTPLEAACVAPNYPIPEFPEPTFSVRDFGATGGGQTNDTPAINQAIEQCSAAGGGTVLFPAGQYAAASIHLRSNVRLLLDSQAVLFGAPGGFEPPETNPFAKYQDSGHSHFHNALMWGGKLEHFAIEGGTINGGNGAIAHFDPNPRQGDKLISIAGGKNLIFHNVKHEKGGHFIYLLNDCENVTFDNIVIKESRDAVDLMGCRNVQIHDCRFTGCTDDTIGIKSDYALGRKINTANIFVWNCYFESGCNGLQVGSETAGDFHNLNCWNVQIGHAMKAGIGITSNDGGIIDGASYSNIVIQGAACPIYMLITDRLRSGDPQKKVGSIRNIKIQDVTVTDCRPGQQGPVNTSAICGRPESSLENISLINVKIHYPGGGQREEAGIIPPYPKDYSPRSLGPRPAAGLYVRHVKGLVLKNVEFTFDQADQRPPLVVSEIDGLTLDDFKAQKTEGIEAVKLERVNHLTVRNCPGLAVSKTTGL